MANENLNPESSASQAKKILAHLKNGGSIDFMRAETQFRCHRLSARIADIEKIIGYPPRRRTRTYRNSEGKSVNYTEYYL